MTVATFIEPEIMKIEEPQKMTYTLEEVIKKSTKWFSGDRLAAEAFAKKYAMRDIEGNIIEKNPDDMFDRLATGLASIEQNKEKWFDQFREVLAGFNKLVLQGSPMAAIGNPRRISASNCFVIESPKDSIKGIYDSVYMMAQIQAYRGGVGVDVSTLRPEGGPVTNAAGSSSGAYSWCDQFSYTTRKIGQRGRVGALMISMRVDHPDILKFIKMKSDLNMVTGANVSVRITDKFMRAVEDDKKIPLWFNYNDSKYEDFREEVPARAIWDSIVENATNHAEPGILMWDNIINSSPADCYADQGFVTVSTNPCVTGDTMLLTADGYKNVKKLWKEAGKQEFVSQYAFAGNVQERLYNPVEKFGKLDIINSHGIISSTNVYRTSECSTIYRVTLENGIFIRATSNHDFILSDGSIRRLEELNVGDELKLIQDIKKANDWYVKKIKSIEYDGEEETFCLTEPENNEVVFNGIITSQCSEIPLCADDSCRLASLHLPGFVTRPFSSSATFDFAEFERVIRISVRALDNIVDLDNVPFEAQKKKAQLGRRLGLGTHGLADCLIKLGLRYDSDESIKFVDKLYAFLKNCAYNASVDLAIEKGAFPIYDVKKEEGHRFLENLDERVKERMHKHGRRNIALLTCAPTGTVSLMSQCSSGVEPQFRFKYTRRIKFNHGENRSNADFVDDTGDAWKEHIVYAHVAQAYMDAKNQRAMNFDDLPNEFVTSDKIDWHRRIEIQATMQKHIDHGISSTINLPEGTSKKIVGDLYMEAWKKGLKGVTVYVEGSRDGVLVADDRKHNKGKVKRPNEIEGIAHVTKGNGSEYCIILGMVEGSIYEIFCLKQVDVGVVDGKKGMIVKRKDDKGNARYDFESGPMTIKWLNRYEDSEISAFTRILSTNLRYGVPLEELIRQLSNSRGSITSIAKSINRVLSKYAGEIRGEKCENCGSTNTRRSEGCLKCDDCESNNCG